MSKVQIALVGGGHLACSLLSGLAAQGFDIGAVRVSDRDDTRLAEIKRQWPTIQTYNSNRRAVADSALVLACVKPNEMRAVCQDIGELLARPSCALLSPAAGVSIDLLEQWSGSHSAIIRCMPNTPVAVGCGMTALYANAQASDEQKKLADNIFKSVGATVWLQDEAQMHLLTALSGSGPAYFFRFATAFEQAARDLGCAPQLAKTLTLHTFHGAARLAFEAKDLSTLIEQVSSKGGTTERGLQALEQADISQIAKAVLLAAADRSVEISDTLAKQSS